MTPNKKDGNAKLGPAFHQFRRALDYEYGGLGVSQDYAKAAEKNKAHAQYRLGQMYRAGHGVERDEAQALEWYRKAAEQGYGMAQHELGVMYATGQGAPQDDAEAQRWFQKDTHYSDGSRNPKAAERLGDMYREGREVKQDAQEADRWYKEAAEGYLERFEELKLSYHAYKLGCLYAAGRGVERDEAKAIEWFRKAAKQRCGEARQALIDMGVTDWDAPEPKKRGRARRAKQDKQAHTKEVTPVNKMTPQELDDLFERGVEALEAEGYAEALDCFQQAAEGGARTRSSTSG